MLISYMKNIFKIFLLLCLFSCTESYDYKVDVLVVGGGASGVCSGVQASRMGVKTMIVEQSPWLGGMLTSAGVSCVDGNYRMQSGIFGEFADSLANRYGGWNQLRTGWVSNINFEPQVGQKILSNIADGCGDNLIVFRECTMCSLKGRKGDWIVCFTRTDGTQFIVKTDVLIDGTELGDVAKAAGVEYRIGMESKYDTGESIAPEVANDIIQDLTYVAVLKDYGPEADMTIDKPEGYDPGCFYNSSLHPRNERDSVTGKTPNGQTFWSPEMMIAYGKTPNGKYMINWPIYGNDYYLNVVEMDPQERHQAYQAAKNFTLCFVYYIQTELGMKNLGLADDVFPSHDKLALFPYHRESRRIVGEAFFTVDVAAKPYEYKYPYYRTGIAVGDYAVDHHHFRHPQWGSLPDLHFYPIPSFNVPMGVLIPKQDDIHDLIVAEKSISVSNLMNGATRLQPVVMQLGQAAGALAAIAVLENIGIKDVGVRQVQSALLDAGCYLMPYLDLPKEHKHFKAVQRVGATGILRGEGRNVGWANQTWLRVNDPLKVEDLFVREFMQGHSSDEVIEHSDANVTIAELFGILSRFSTTHLSACLPNDTEEQKAWWESIGLEDFSCDRSVTRLEAAVVIDVALDPFSHMEVDYNGNFI